MKIREIVQTTPKFRVLSEDEIERIYFDALGIIESDGALVKSQKALDLFAGSEAAVTGESLVRIPAVLVERALREHPGKIALAGRTGERSVRLQKDELAFGAGPVFPQKNGTLGGTACEQVRNAALLADYLTGIDFIAGHLKTGTGKNDSWDLKCVSALLEGSCKPLLLGVSGRKELQTLWEMMCVVSGGKKEFQLGPLFACYCGIDSPLTLSETEAEKILFCAEHKIPCVCASNAVSGVTAPESIPGTLVLTLAETMLVSVLSYLQNPGMPLIRGGVTTAAGLSGDAPAFSAPQLGLSAAANTDVSKWLGLAMFSPAGITDSESIDQDAGTDWVSGLYYAFLSGADLIYGSGLIRGGTGFCPDSLVVCDEIIRMIGQIGKGISTEEEYLATGLIAEVGPGGEYLTQDHTLEHWQEWFRPELVDRAVYQNWAEAGKKTMAVRAAEKREKILKEYAPEPFDPKLAEELRALADARQKEG
ncbi:MAG: trimethylamine methyltransferase family protein [Desulfobacteraceae bacterium]|nr:trimethylamine methyltransferase family protein [Desulfobacteraceae bacterium]